MSNSKRCAHCGGTTKCDCASCGQTFVIDTYTGLHKSGQTTRSVAGKCTVCNGTGMISD